MKKEITGYGRFVLLLLVAGAAITKEWRAFWILLVLTIVVYYAHEYRKMNQKPEKINFIKINEARKQEQKRQTKQ